jgi:hypothetical protein
MKTQTQKTALPIDRDREDADRALAFYCEVRATTKLKPLEVILGVWGTPHWSDASKEMFLMDIYRKQACDEGVKNLNYPFESINTSRCVVVTCAGGVKMLYKASSKTIRLRSVATIEQDIKQLPHQPGVYIVRVGGNGWVNGAVVYVGKAEASVRSRWIQRTKNFREGDKENSDFKMMFEVAAMLARDARITVEARPVTLKQFRGNREKMKRRIRHDEGMLIDYYRKPRLNKRLERDAIDPWLKTVDRFWGPVDRLLVFFAFGLALLFKLLTS